MARPKLNIDPEQVKRLALIQCTVEEMASVLRCDKRTLERRFAAIIKEGRESGRMSLKRKQFELAMGGNVAMLIWLGKQTLGQREPQRVELTGADGKPIENKLEVVVTRLTKPE